MRKSANNLQRESVQWCRWILTAGLTAAWLAISTLDSAAENLDYGGAFSHWLVEAGLSTVLQVDKVYDRFEITSRLPLPLGSEAEPPARRHVLDLESDVSPTAWSELATSWRAAAGGSLGGRLVREFAHVRGAGTLAVRVDVTLDCGWLSYVATPTGEIKEWWSPCMGIETGGTIDLDSLRLASRIASPVADTLALPAVDLGPRVREFFQMEFSGLADFLVETQDRWEVLVEGVRGRVIPNRNYWERLTIRLEVQAEENPPRATCEVEASLAPGLGSRQPPLQRYTDMEVDDGHRRRLEEFTKRLFNNLKRYLESEGEQ